MDLQRFDHGVLCCHLCNVKDPPMYCAICHIHLCKTCVGHHISDKSKEHNVIPLQKWVSATKCEEHTSKICEHYCKRCDKPICVQCASSAEHESHEFIAIGEKLEIHKNVIQKDLQELKNSIYPNYQDNASIISDQKADFKQNSHKLMIAIDEHGENWHKVIDSTIKKLKSDLNEMDSKLSAVLNKKENEIMGTISEIEQKIANLKEKMSSNDFRSVSIYESRNDEYRKLPTKLILTLPRFIPQKINTEHIYQEFGSLSTLSMDSSDVKSSPPYS